MKKKYACPACEELESSLDMLRLHIYTRHFDEAVFVTSKGTVMAVAGRVCWCGAEMYGHDDPTHRHNARELHNLFHANALGVKP